MTMFTKKDKKKKSKDKDDGYYDTHYTDEEIEKLSAQNLDKRQRKKLKETINDAMETAMDQSAGKIRQRYYPRWRKVCGVETDAEIDFSNPIVSTEWLLCDPRIQRELIQGRRENVLAQMTEVQQ